MDPNLGPSFYATPDPGPPGAAVGPAGLPDATILGRGDSDLPGPLDELETVETAVVAASGGGDARVGPVAGAYADPCGLITFGERNFVESRSDPSVVPQAVEPTLNRYLSLQSNCPAVAGKT